MRAGAGVVLVSVATFLGISFLSAVVGIQTVSRVPRLAPLTRQGVR